MSVAKSIAEIHAMHVKAGKCRHCGGRVPCWSEFGDRAVGKRHTLKSWRARRTEAEGSESAS